MPFAKLRAGSGARPDFFPSTFKDNSRYTRAGDVGHPPVTKNPGGVRIIVEQNPKLDATVESQVSKKRETLRQAQGRLWGTRLDVRAWSR